MTEEKHLHKNSNSRHRNTQDTVKNIGKNRLHGK